MTSTAGLSVAIVAHNEEANIRACLESVKWADEIIVIDAHSTDRTAQIARELGALVIQRPWPGHVEQKNFALQQTTRDWVLSIDADERVSPELAEEIRGIISRDERHFVGYSMPRKTFYLGRWITHGGWYPDRKLRLVRRGAGVWRGVNPHDHLYAEGPVGELKGCLEHYTYKDIADHLRKIDSYTTIAAREMNARGKGLPVLRMLLHPVGRFLRMYFLRGGFLDGVPGFIVAVLASYYVFLKYAKLWELQHVGPGSTDGQSRTRGA